MQSKLLIGCSGYNYSLWKGEFYPKDLPASKWLPYFSSHFPTVEINASFYKFPTVKNLQTWYNKTPEDFTFSIKANRIITHYRKFKEVGDPIQEFYQIVREGLKDKLGTILFQLPPSFSYSKENLDNILLSLSSDFNNVVEFRHESWWIPEVYKALEEHSIAFCSVSYPQLADQLIITGKIAYLRFHGKQELFKSTYTREELSVWAEQIKLHKCDVMYIYFNNTWYNGAIENARMMEELLKDAL